MIRFDRINYLTVVMMLLFSYLSFGALDKKSANDPFLVLLLSSAVYFMTVYLYFGIANMAYENRNNLLWISGIVAIVLGYMVSGLSNLYLMLTGWSMLLFGGALAGRLTFRKRPAATVYIVGTVAVGIFAIAYYWPIWPLLTDSLNQYFVQMTESLRSSMLTMGYGADAVNESVESAHKMGQFIVRVMPALSVLGSVMQFSIGYLLFLIVLERFKTGQKLIQPFSLWKMPFWLMPVAIVAMLLILLGGNSLEQFGENLLVFLVVYYAITGLALIEFYLKKFKFSLFFKILFYIFLALTQLVGFFAAALLGFVDSFTDWRKVQSLSFENE